MGNRVRTFDDAAIAEYCKTHTPIEAEQHFDCSRATVSNAMRKHQVQALSVPQSRRIALADYIRENPDKSAAVIASERKISIQTVRSVAAEFSLSFSEPTPVNVVSLTSFEIIAMLWNSGLNGAEIAREIGVSRQRVDQIEQTAIKCGLLGPDSFLQLKERVECQETEQESSALSS